MKKKLFYSFLLVLLFCYIITPEWKEFGTHFVERVFYSQPEVVEDDAVYIMGKPIKQGDDIDTVMTNFGETARIDASEYSFKWHIYNEDYSNYFQVGMENDKVGGLYTNAQTFLFRGISVGMTKARVMNLLGESLESIQKGNMICKISALDQRSVYLIDDKAYLTVFYDTTENDTVTAIQLIDKEVELNLNGFYGKPSKELKESFEMESLDLVNSVRARYGLNMLKFDSKAQISAREHSSDMEKRNYFDHKTPEGKTPFDRMKAAGVWYSAAAENIASGMASSIYAHELLMNSPGHRVNILSPNYDCLGVGVTITPERGIYLTQNFFGQMKFIMR